MDTVASNVLGAPSAELCAVIVLQARLSSTRCPGKVLADLAGHPLIFHCLDRLVAADNGPVILATSTQPEDDAVAEAGTRAGVQVCRGALEDVLGRFELAVRTWSGPFVIRATADNPAVDMVGVARVLKRLIAGADYVVETGLPIGGAVEGVRTSVLREAARRATTPYEREHVTPFVYNRPDEFQVVRLQAPPAVHRPDLRFTVDTQSDLDYMRAVFGRVSGPLPSLEELIAAADDLQRDSGAGA